MNAANRKHVRAIPGDAVEEGCSRNEPFACRGPAIGGWGGARSAFETALSYRVPDERASRSGNSLLDGQGRLIKASLTPPGAGR